MSELLEGLFEDLVRLRPEHDQAAVEQECGDRVDTDRVGLGGRTFDLLFVEISTDRSIRVLEAELRRERAENGRIADVQTLLPVRSHEQVVRGAVLALRSCQLGQAEGRMRVRNDVRRRVVDELLPLECQLEVSVEGLPVPPDEVRARDPLRWVLGVQVEGQPLDLGAEPALEPLGRALTDAAEGSDVIRPDQDLVHCHMARLAGPDGATARVCGLRLSGRIVALSGQSPDH